PGEALEVALDVVAGGAALDAQVLGKAEGTHAVDQAEVDDLGVAALLALHFFRRQAEDLGSGGAVDVLAGRERAQHRLVARDVGHDAQLDLRVVGRYDHFARRGDEGFADAAAFGGAYRDVLQVRVARRQA